MKKFWIVSGIMAFMGFALVVVAASNHFETAPYGDGASAFGVVVRHDGSPGSLHAIVRYFDTDGIERFGRVETEGRLRKESTVEISYRPDKPEEVRIPSFRDPGNTTDLALGLLLGLGGGAAMLWLGLSPAARQRSTKSHRLERRSASDPAVLRQQLENFVGDQLGEPVLAAFMVNRRRPDSELLPRLVALTVIPMLVVGALTRSGALAILPGAFFGIGYAIVQARGRAVGVVAVSHNALTLVSVPNNDLRRAEVLQALPRSTELPPPEIRHVAREMILSGDGLPFTVDDGGPPWRYMGDLRNGGFRVKEVIEWASKGAQPQPVGSMSGMAQGTVSSPSGTAPTGGSGAVAKAIEALEGQAVESVQAVIPRFNANTFMMIGAMVGALVFQVPYAERPIPQVLGVVYLVVFMVVVAARQSLRRYLLTTAGEYLLVRTTTRSATPKIVDRRARTEGVNELLGRRWLRIDDSIV